MPAIQLSRLRMQTAQLSELFDQPDRYLRGLHDVLEFYADRTFRPGQTGKIPSLLPYYLVPAPVMRAVEDGLAPLCAAHPETALALADALWADTHLEPRQLAIFVLSQAPADPPDALLQRLEQWAMPGEDRQLLALLLSRAPVNLQRRHPALWAAHIRDWLTSDQADRVFIGLHAVLSIVNDPSYDNLPAVFRLLGSVIANMPRSLQRDLLEVLEALARRSPKETLYFLRQVLNVSHSAEVPRLLRRCLPFFEGETQNALRAALKTYAENPQSG